MYVRVDGDTATYTTLTDLRFSFSNVSFPATITDEDAEQFGVHPCKQVAAPETDHTKNVVMGDPTRVDGLWQQTWVVSDASENEIIERIAAQWDSVRAERNMRLMACDWTQLPDCPLDTAKKFEWIGYRQALRDITEQADPFDIAWPQEPE